MFAGVGLNSSSRSSAGSSGGSSSRHSDLIQQFATGSDTTEVQHLTHSDVSTTIRNMDPMLYQCWDSVADAGPTLIQHRIHISRSLG